MSDFDISEETKTRLRTADMRRRGANLDAKTSEVLLRLYLARRVNYQWQYYDNQVKESEGNSEFMFKIGALVMTISSLLSALGTAAVNTTNTGATPAWTEAVRLATAILPAVAALIGSFTQLYQWDRQASLYRDSMLGLERARLVSPDLDELDGSTALRVFPELVKQTEVVFQDEVNQWGQIALGKDVDGKDIDPVVEFAKQYGIDIYDDKGQIDEKKLGEFRAILEASQKPTGKALTLQPNQELVVREQTSQVTVAQPNEVTVTRAEEINVSVEEVSTEERSKSRTTSRRKEKTSEPEIKTISNSVITPTIEEVIPVTPEGQAVIAENGTSIEADTVVAVPEIDSELELDEDTAFRPKP